MQQWHGIQEAFHRAGTEVEALIHDSLADEIFEQPGLYSCRQRCVQNAFNRDKSLFQSDGVPHRSPECHALCSSRRMHVLWSDFEQAVHGSGEFSDGDAESLRYPRRSDSGHIAADFDEVQLAVTYDDLIGWQIVVNVGEVNG